MSQYVDTSYEGRASNPGNKGDSRIISDVNLAPSLYEGGPGYYNLDTYEGATGYTPDENGILTQYNNMYKGVVTAPKDAPVFRGSGASAGWAEFGQWATAVGVAVAAYVTAGSVAEVFSSGVNAGAQAGAAGASGGLSDAEVAMGLGNTASGAAGGTAGAAGGTAGAAGGTAGAAGSAAASSLPEIVVTGTQGGGALSGLMQGAGIAGQAGVGMITAGQGGPPKDAAPAATEQVGPPKNLAPQPKGLLSKIGDFVKSPIGQTLTNVAGNVLQGSAQGRAQEAEQAARNEQSRYYDTQWRDQSQLDKLKTAVADGPTVSSGYLDRARRVSEFLNGTQTPAGAPGNPAQVYGSYVRGQ